MRAHQFITEYKRDVTAQSMGDKLFQALAKSPLSAMPDSLYTAHTIADMAFHPDKYSNWGIGHKSMSFGGNKISLGLDNAKEVAAKLKPEIISTILAEIEAQDPTANKEYTQWLARTWANSGGQAKIEDMNRNNYLATYTLAKRRQGLIPAEARDINKFKSYRDFEDWMYENGIADKVADQDKQRADKNKGDAETVFDDANVRVIHPKDEDAACYYGQGTRWCTAATEGSNMFDNYNRQGPMYILLPKKPEYEGEKYQLHFYSEQFMNEQDDPVSLSYLLTKRFPELLDFFKEREPVIGQFIEFADDDLLEGLGKIIGEIISDAAWEVLLEWQDNDDYFREWQAEQAEERGYVDEDGDIDWDRVNEDDDLNDYADYNDEAGRMMRRVNEIRNLTGKAIKSYAEESLEDLDDEGTPTIESLDGIYGWIVDDEVGEEGHSIAEFLRKRVVVTPKSRHTPKYQGNIVDQVGDWVVSITPHR